MRTDVVYAFGPYRLDVRVLRLTRGGVIVVLPMKHVELLHALVSRAGQVVSKDDLIRVAWQHQSASDNSLAQAILLIRDTLDPDAPSAYIETVRGHGYRFVAVVEAIAPRFTDADRADVLARHQSWFDGRAMLESLVIAQVIEARGVFEDLLRDGGDDDVRVHIGLANACAMISEHSRASAVPDIASRRLAYRHAVTATERAPDRAEAWATLGFVLGIMRRDREARAALDCAMRIDAGNWRVFLRLALVTWGTPRLEALARVLTLMPGLPMAHWLVASVHVARNALKAAARELDLALAIVSRDASLSARFQAVGLHWLRGLLFLADGQGEKGIASFQREVALEIDGHIYASECAAQVWCGIGACHLRSDEQVAREAFDEAIRRVPGHPQAHLGLAILDARGDDGSVAAHLEVRLHAVATSRPVDPDAADRGLPTHVPFEVHVARAAALKADGRIVEGMRLLLAALEAAPPGNSGWFIPLDPFLRVMADPETAATLLGTLSDRAW